MSQLDSEVEIVGHLPPVPPVDAPTPTNYVPDGRPEDPEETEALRRFFEGGFDDYLENPWQLPESTAEPSETEVPDESYGFRLNRTPATFAQTLSKNPPPTGKSVLQSTSTVLRPQPVQQHQRKVPIQWVEPLPSGTTLASCNNMQPSSSPPAPLPTTRLGTSMLPPTRSATAPPKPVIGSPNSRTNSPNSSNNGRQDSRATRPPGWPTWAPSWQPGLTEDQYTSTVVKLSAQASRARGQLVEVDKELTRVRKRCYAKIDELEAEIARLKRTQATAPTHPTRKAATTKTTDDLVMVYIVKDPQPGQRVSVAWIPRADATTDQ